MVDFEADENPLSSISSVKKSADALRVRVRVGSSKLTK